MLHTSTQSFIFLSSSQIFQVKWKPNMSGFLIHIVRATFNFKLKFYKNSVYFSGLRVSILTKLFKKKRNVTMNAKDG